MPLYRFKILARSAGFTLIEMLVVILIIGIFAAIALPQYRKAVFSSRMKEVELTMKALDTALAEYQLVNGLGAIPTSDFSNLTVNITENCSNIGSSLSSGWYIRYQCKNFQIGLAKTPGINRRIVAIMFFDTDGDFNHFDIRDGKFVCRFYGSVSSSIYKSYCKNMGYATTNG